MSVYVNHSSQVIGPSKVWALDSMEALREMTLHIYPGVPVRSQGTIPGGSYTGTSTLDLFLRASTYGFWVMVAKSLQTNSEKPKMHGL